MLGRLAIVCCGVCAPSGGVSLALARGCSPGSFDLGWLGGCELQGALMLREHRPVDDDRHVQHVAAVRQSLGWADAAARAGDHADALHWLDVVEAVGDVLPADYTAKREAWRRAVREAGAAGQPTG